MKKWSGDNSFQLPAKQVEPYRLWFEFLKLADRDPTVEIDNIYYQSWGNYRTQNFTAWWSENWRSLFAVDVGVYALRPDQYRSIGDGDIIVRIPFHQSASKSASQVRQLIENYQKNSSLQKKAAGKNSFSIGKFDEESEENSLARFMKNLEKVRLYLHLYRFWLEAGDVSARKRLHVSCLNFYQWAYNWNKKISYKKDGSLGKRPMILIPDAVYYYSIYLSARGGTGKLTRDQSLAADVPANIAEYQRQVSRYITKARKIAANVASGIFPGTY